MHPLLSRFKKALVNRHYSPLNRVYISKQKLYDNYDYLSSLHPLLQIAPVLKSNAYGHGIAEIGSLLQAKQPPLVCVDSLLEANQLKTAGVKIPTLIMGFIDPDSLQTSHLPFSFTVFNLEFAEALSQYQPGAKIHIFVDTGMHREGVLVSQLPQFLEKIKKLHLEVEGLMSHFASADDLKGEQTREQEAVFQQAIKILQATGLNPKWIHLSASNGLFTAKNTGCNLARIGKALYGIDPLGKTDSKLQPILKLTSKIAQIKHIQKGDPVGYGATFTAKKDMIIGILPIGYNDGVERRLSNKGITQIDGKKAAIIGRISMNITTIDLTDIPDPYITQEVVIFSDNPTDPNSIQNSAKLADTIPHDLLIHINPSTLRREIVT